MFWCVCVGWGGVDSRYVFGVGTWVSVRKVNLLLITPLMMINL